MVKREEIDKRVIRILAIGVGALFFYAGASKIIDPVSFAQAIQNYRLVPDVVARLLACYLPWLEMVGGTCLVLKRYYQGALFLIAMLTMNFLGAVTSAKLRGLDISCGCFVASRLVVASLNGALLRLVFLVIIISVLLWGQTRVGSDVPKRSLETRE